MNVALCDTKRPYYHTEAAQCQALVHFLPHISHEVL